MTETRTEHDVLGALTRRRFLQGSALAGFGILMSISTHKQLVQS